MGRCHARGSAAAIRVACCLTALAATGLGGTSCSSLECGEGTVREGDRCVATGQDGAVDRIEAEDLTGSRGAPVTLTDRGTVSGNLFGIHSDRVVLTDPDCEISYVDISVCEYRWVDDSGSTTATVSGGTPVNADRYVSLDAAWMVLLTETQEACYDDMDMRIYAGTTTLVDAARGTPSWSQAGVHTYIYTGSAFSLRETWFSVPEPVASPCGGPDIWLDNRFELRQVTDPSVMVPPESQPYGAVELATGDFLGVLDAGGEPRLALMDPMDPVNPRYLADGPAYNLLTFQVTDAVVHGAFKPGLQVEQWTHLLYDVAAGTVHLYPVPADTWLKAYNGRWVVHCGQQEARPVQECIVHDMRGEHPDSSLVVRDHGSSVWVAGSGDGLYYVGLAEPPDTWASVAHVDLITGQQTVIREAWGTLLGVPGSPRAMLRDAQGRLWLLEPGKARLMVENVVEVRAPQWPGIWAATQAATERPTLIVSRPTFFSYRLSLWDEGEGRLAHLSDRLYFDSSHWDDRSHCASPGVPRGMGRTPSEGHVFFSEISDDFATVSLFLVPADLSAPPRSLGSVETDRCRPVRVSPDGGRAAVFHKAWGETDGELWVGAL